MSLRKSPELTPELVEAARRNAQHATGPRSAAGKEKMKMNALKHGLYAAAENHQLTMLALGEDPQEFDALQQELLTTYGPGDALWRRQLEDLAKLYWRRGRLERMQTGVMRRALQEVEEGQHRREQEMANATFDPSHPEMLEITAAESTDPGVRLRRILSSLGVIRARVAQDPLSGPAASPIGPVAQTSALEAEGSSPGPENRGSTLPAKDGRAGSTQSAIDNQQSTIGNRKTGGPRYQRRMAAQEVRNQQSTISNRQSAIGNRKTGGPRYQRRMTGQEVRNQQSTIGNRHWRAFTGA